MMRVIVGLVKGAVVGGLVAFGTLRLTTLGLPTGLVALIAFAGVGALVGLVAGQPPWRAETLWTPALKVIIGVAICVGLGYLGLHFLPNPTFHIAQIGIGDVELHSGPALALPLALVYGLFVEVDDGGKAAPSKSNAPKPLPKKKA